MSKKLRELQAKRAALANEKATALNAASAVLDEAGDIELTAEQKAQFDGHKAVASDKTRQIAQIDERIELEKESAQSAAAAGVAYELPGSGVVGSSRDNREEDPRRGFASKGEFFKAVKNAAQAASMGVAVDERLRIGAAAPGTFSGEGSGADGGFAIPPEYSAEIWRLSLAEGSLLPMTQNTEVTGNSMVFPKDETTPWGGDGVQAYWKGEGTSGAVSKIALGNEMLRLKELMVLVPMTNELLEDAAALGSYLTPLASERIQWKANEAILFGTGGGQPLGCFNSPALVTVAKESGQAAATINQMNISKMRSRLKTGELSNAVWIGNPDILPTLESMTVGQTPIFLPPGTGIREGGYDGTLNGRPLILSEHANALGTAGDLNLVSLKGYRTITKSGGIQTATSMHLYFDANATAFRFIFRMDGMPIIKGPIAPPTGKSSNTRSYFVNLAARA